MRARSSHKAAPNVVAKIIRDREVFVKDPRLHATQVMLPRPLAGDWKLRALPGSTITGLEQAQVDTKATVEASVLGSGEHRVLCYVYQRQPLHTTRFIEEGANYEQELGMQAGGPCKGVRAIHPDPPDCGEISFTPAAGPAGVRPIYAITTMNGEETARQLIATDDAPAEPEPSIVPALVVRREGDTVKISWDKSRAPILAAMPMDYRGGCTR
jgi:hypothetical protein